MTRLIACAVRQCSRAARRSLRDRPLRSVSGLAGTGRGDTGRRGRADGELDGGPGQVRELFPRRGYGPPDGGEAA